MNYSISQLLQEARDLPPIPQAVQRALTLIYDPESNAAELASILSTDQALAAIWKALLTRAESKYSAKLVTLPSCTVKTWTQSTS